MNATHDEYTSIRKIRNVFIPISFVVPIILWILNEVFIAYLEVDLCSVGSPIHADSKLIVQSNFTDVEGKHNSTIDIPEQPCFVTPQSPLFLVVEEYVPTSIISRFKIASYVIQCIFYSNIPEGVLAEGLKESFHC